MATSVLRGMGLGLLVASWPKLSGRFSEGSNCGKFGITDDNCAVPQGTAMLVPCDEKKLRQNVVHEKLALLFNMPNRSPPPPLWGTIRTVLRLPRTARYVEGGFMRVLNKLE